MKTEEQIRDRLDSLISQHGKYTDILNRTMDQMDYKSPLSRYIRELKQDIFLLNWVLSDDANIKLEGDD